MYDSEEDVERRGRDKFPRERDYRRDDDRRGSGFIRSDYSNGAQKRSSSGRRDDYGVGPGAKRGRIDNASDTFDPVLRSSDDASACTMMTFKKFLMSQEDDISDEDAIAKYNEYKMDFKRQQLQKFFNAHKDEEWFRIKYHPDESKKWADAHMENIEKRLEIFNDLKATGSFEKISLDLDNAKDVIRIMDTLVVRLEGGSAEDVEALKLEKIEDESLEDISRGNEEVKSKPKEGDEDAISDGEVPETEAEKRKKMLLHKTSSIFLRNVPPSVTINELEAMCKRSPGFLRVALADPIPDRKFFRRGWATYKRDVNIKEICWNLNSIRIRDSDLNAIINRDLTRRIRTTNGITAHKQVAQNDLRQAVKLVALLDKRVGLFSDEPAEEREKDIRMGVNLVGTSKNPLIKEVRDILLDIEEVSPEEEELLGLSRGGSTFANGSTDEKSKFNRDETILKALDQLILYMRIVHSVDFYNHGEYPNEDSMPNRCGMLHVRGQTPSASQWGADEDGTSLVSNKFITDFTNGFNQRLENSLIQRESISEEELERLGKKDGEKEVEAFIQQNTVELAKDKWLCPLSGKKFKGPEFIRKHLMSKHDEKLSEVKHEATFYNNYLADAKRPVDAEPKIAPATSSRDGDDRRDDRYESRGNYSERVRPPPPRYDGYGRAPQRDYGRGAGRFDGEGRRDPRPQVTYRDLDAPEDIV